MRVIFWGVRGSVPCPGPDTVRYGGNTTCVELRCEAEGRMFIIDAGTGIRPLGDRLARRDIPAGLRRVDIFLSHSHWDHILGLPFFAPLYMKGIKVRFYGPVTFEQDSLEKVLRGQFAYRYFPVRIEELASELEFVELGEGAVDLGDGVRLTTKYLNHPVSCMGYRFECDGKSVATAFDTEPFRNLFAADPTDPAFDAGLVREGETAAAEQNGLVEEFMAGADLVIHDAQYTREEYLSSRIGWGHSSMEHALESCRRARVRRLAMTHHDPDRTDAQLDALQETLCGGAGDGMQAFFAREGMELKV